MRRGTESYYEAGERKENLDILNTGSPLPSGQAPTFHSWAPTPLPHQPSLTLLLLGLPNLRGGQERAWGVEASAAAEAVGTGPGTGDPGLLEWETPGSWGLGAWPSWGAGGWFSDEGAIECAGVGKQGHPRASGVPGDHCENQGKEEAVRGLGRGPPLPSPPCSYVGLRE